MKMWVVFCWALLALVGADECPDGGRCKDGQTCCNDPPANGYECCPFDQAECCGDHKHCCPMGTVCDTATSSCLNSTGSMPWVERASADQLGLSKSFRMIKTYMGEDDDNICPDKSRCPPEFSCLKALTRFGCCPLAQGVSCSDGKHCCPEGHQCSADSRSCIKKELVTTVLCSDGVSECPDETTCCITTEGTWGCCPMPQAVCCEDKTHCCPEGNTCDVAHSKCISSSTKKESPMWAKLPARIREDWENQKEGDQVTAQTVVVGGSEKSPELTTANTVPPSEKEVNVSSVTKAASGNDVPCNDTASCPDDTTCCKTQEGEWACCPLPEAVCCDDHEHCCPAGTTCDPTTFQCDGTSGSTPMKQKIPAFVTAAPTTAASTSQTEGNDVPCDETGSCPDDTTCCKTQEGGWACCPLPEAVCCEDFIHCCPKGKTCNVAAQKCEDDTHSVPWVQKVPTKPRQGVRAQDVKCDETGSCPDDTTCCKTQEGEWACCPLPEAVCCEDFIHCCPKGKKCNLAAQSCDDDTHSVPWVQKVPTKPTQVQTEKETESEQADEKKAQETDDDQEKEDEEEEENKEEEDVPCDKHTSCPAGASCCFMKSTQKWGCCPLPEAVCCADGNHCCPKHYKCDESKTTCVKGEVEIPWYTKLPATTRAEADHSSVQCDDTIQCPDHTTCCQLSMGEWGCCPLPNAVCCQDKEHCCPQGFTCNAASNSCQKLILLEVEFVPVTPVLSLSKHRDVPCDEQTSCPDGQTCCRTSATEWGCCPYPNAVCCSDMLHCCPTGYTCTSTGDCTQNSRLQWHDWYMFLANKKRALVV